jgi:L-iditol 2-dehydrogenase
MATTTMPALVQYGLDAGKVEMRDGKAVTVAGSFSHNFRTWERVIGLLASKQIDVDPLVGLDAPLDSWREGFDGMHAGRISKAVLRP